ncbi:MAG: FAD-dependent thymidylate synthase [Treponema sp.]|nr:FAD-dependent thymidylate synthase [Treponema sp.]
MITIIEKRTEKDPLSHIGENAGVCWNSDITDVEKNIKRGKSCIQSGHLRTAEYPTVEMIIEGYSARCIRELYTHIIGVTRLQDSTRYINFEDFAYYNPGTTEEQKEQIAKTMGDISENYGKLLDLGMKKEDCANILPLGMHTKIVWKINLRGLIHFMNMRLCNRALKEIRTLAGEIKIKLSAYSDEWKWICDNYFVPTCKSIGYCTEEKCCGLMPKGLDGLKEKIIEDYKKELENQK